MGESWNDATRVLYGYLQEDEALYEKALDVLDEARRQEPGWRVTYLTMWLDEVASHAAPTEGTLTNRLARAAANLIQYRQIAEKMLDSVGVDTSPWHRD